MITKKQTLIIVIVTLISIVLSTVFASTNVSHFAPLYAKTTANVNLRKEPTTNTSSYVKTLQKDTNIKLVGSIDNYYIVQTEKNEVGLVSKDYVEKTGEQFYSDVYTDFAPFTTTVAENNVSLRGGPSTSFPKYASLSKDQEVYVIGAINDFLLVVTQNNTVGMVRQDLITPPNVQEGTQNEVNENNSNVNSNEEEISNNGNIEEVTIEDVLNKINAKRAEAGLPNLELDELVTSTAQAKAKDMVTNNYFSHLSPTYGTPFEMLTNAGVKYKTAGENIAGNTNVLDAIDSFFNSESHSKNMLSNAYNYIGIGIEKSKIYGNVIVLMFIGR